MSRSNPTQSSPEKKVVVSPSTPTTISLSQEVQDRRFERLRGASPMSEEVRNEVISLALEKYEEEIVLYSSDSGSPFKLVVTKYQGSGVIVEPIQVGDAQKSKEQPTPSAISVTGSEAGVFLSVTGMPPEAGGDGGRSEDDSESSVDVSGDEEDLCLVSPVEVTELSVAEASLPLGDEVFDEMSGPHLPISGMDNADQIAHFPVCCPVDPLVGKNRLRNGEFGDPSVHLDEGPVVEEPGREEGCEAPKASHLWKPSWADLAGNRNKINSPNLRSYKDAVKGSWASITSNFSQPGIIHFWIG
ncbi:hypothetical protein U1Q18_027958 [Sarracenia purpurea var. burkii]